MLPLVLSVALIMSPSGLPAPAAWLRGPQPPSVQAEAYILYDEAADAVLLQQNADEQRAMASVTKLMTALVATERLQPDASTVVSATAAGVGESEIGLVAGERWNIRDLLAAMLVRSANDAAVAIAEAAGGSVDAFVRLMNGKAVELGMTNTHFANPHGLDAEDHYSTAADLVILARAAIDDPLVSRLARTHVVRFLPDPETGKQRRAVNTNHLLGAYPGTVGLKTGFTSDAGKVLVGAAARGRHRLFTVVMGSEDHFDDTRRLLNYGFSSFGPADRFLGGLAGEEGGGPTPGIQVAPWLSARIAAMPPLDDGRWAMSDLASLPLGEALRDLLDRFGVAP